MVGRPALRLWASIGLVLLAGLLAACSMGMPKDLKPVPRMLTIAMHDKGMDEKAPILIRIFKEESQLEVWKQAQNGQYALLKTYEICKWSGELGPKKVEGDRQAPEGFYNVTPAQMNPNSNYYLSFNIGYPNTFDQSWGRTGSNLMVHGACSSAGCYSMTDEAAGELFALARDAFAGGQRNFQIQAFPFRMTAENMARHHDNANMPFWRMLKVGYDSFEITRTVPKVDVCEKQYVFNADANGGRFDPAGRCPAYAVPEPLATALAKKQAEDDQKVTVLVASLKSGGGTGGPHVPVAVASASRPIPAILDRIGLGGSAPAATTTTAVVSTPVAVQPTTTVATTAPAATLVPAAAPSTPIPTTKPVVAAKPAVVTTTTLSATPVPASKPAVATTGTPAPTLAPPADAGTIVNRKFWWDDVPATAKGGA